MIRWFTADCHFGHVNIIKHSHRPFENVDDMDETIINNLNVCVKKEDMLYIVGDFCGQRRKADYIQHYADQINCKNIILIFGNHDDQAQTRKVFDSCYDMYTVKVKEDKNQHVVLCHYAMKVWAASHRGTWHLYGHSHGNLEEDPHSKSFDIGVDCWDYYPLYYDLIKTHMDKKLPFIPVDHHTETLQ